MSATPVLGSRRLRVQVAAFFRANPLPSGARVLRQALERFASYAEFRKRSGPQRMDYLATR